MRTGWANEPPFGTNRESEISALTLMDPIHRHARCTEIFLLKLTSNTNTKSSGLKIRIRGREIEIRSVSPLP